METKRSIPTFLQLAGSHKGLLDGFGIVAALNEDLKGAEYEAPPQPVDIPDKREKVRSDEVKKNKARVVLSEAAAVSPSSSSTSKPLKTLKDYAAGNYSDDDLIRGFDDGEGGVQFVIGSIVEYHPKKGVLVHWKGWSEDDRTWETLDNIPHDWSKEVRHARRQYEKINSKDRS